MECPWRLEQIPEGRNKEVGTADPTAAAIPWREPGWYNRDARKPWGWSTVGK